MVVTPSIPHDWHMMIMAWLICTVFTWGIGIFFGARQWLMALIGTLVFESGILVLCLSQLVEHAPR